MEIARRAISLILFPAIIIGWLAGCRGQNISVERLASCLRAERDLTIRIPAGPVRSDSLKIIRRAFGIDPDRSISGLRGNPEIWEKLLKELKNDK